MNRCEKRELLAIKVKEVCGSQQECADRLGISRITMSRKMNGADFTEFEIVMLVQLLGINVEQAHMYFG